MFDAFYIYMYYQRMGGRPFHVTCGEKVDVSASGGLDIHGNLNFVPVEFAGAVTTVFFYVSVTPLKESCLIVSESLFLGCGST